MSVLDIVRVIVYRFHEKGLEIFLLNSDIENDPDVWKLPEGKMISSVAEDSETIDLEPSQDTTGRTIRTMAVEGEWHDIPSIRGLLKHDVKLVKSKIKEVVPEAERGGFFAVKEAMKKIMPDEYKALKELKDVLTDRNLTKYI